jgi:glycosyltransferase involved in cell wall biosynthesis
MFSVVIPSRGNRESLFQCIDSCLTQRLEGGGGEGLEVLVVLDRPSMKCRTRVEDWAKRDRRVRVLYSSGAGVNAARNRGVAESKGELLYFLDDDCVLPSSTHLQKLGDFVARNPDFDVVGGHYSNPASAEWSVRCYNLQVRLWIEAGRGERVVNLVGGNVCYRKKVFQLGLRFDPESRVGGDETEFHRRLLSFGFRFGFLPDLPVIHSADASLKTAALRAWVSGLQAGTESLATQLTWRSILNAARLLLRSPLGIPYFAIYRMIMTLGKARAYFAPMIMKRSNENPG